MKWLNGITNSMDVNPSKLQVIVKDREAWRATVHGDHKELNTTQELNNKCLLIFYLMEGTTVRILFLLTHVILTVKCDYMHIL